MDLLPVFKGEDCGLCELVLVVRPEDRAAVARALESVAGAAFVCHHVLGRGFDGGLVYGPPSRRKWLGWLERSQVLMFLPKIVFFAVLDRRSAGSIIERAGAAIRQTGAPSACAGGFAFVAPIGQEIPIGIGRAGERGGFENQGGISAGGSAASVASVQAGR